MTLNGQPIEDVMKTVATRLRQARELRKTSQTQLAKRIGTSPNQISMIENGQSGTSIRTLVAAASALNVSIDFLAGLSDDPRPARELLYALRKSRARNRDLEGSLRDLPAIDSYEQIEVMDIHTAAGAGAVVHGEGVNSMIPFPRAWLREHGLKPSDCRVISVVGESMEPTLANGCAILVDLISTYRRSGRIFVIRTGNELIVKRVVRDHEAGWLLVSDNPDKTKFPTDVWPDNASIVGEVKWHGQSFT